jgi:hypothetical protein
MHAIHATYAPLAAYEETTMFGKKQSTPKALWAVQLLTTDYLVDGNLDPDDPTGSWFLHVQSGELAMATLTLTQARMQPTGGLNATMPTAAKWSLPSTGMFVACIPRDEGGTAYALKRNSSSKHPIAGVVFVGPYAIRGTILSPDAGVDILAGYLTFAMQQVVIDCLAPGARLTGLAAPYVLVRSLLLHGIATSA